MGEKRKREKNLGGVGGKEKRGMRRVKECRKHECTMQFLGRISHWICTFGRVCSLYIFVSVYVYICTEYKGDKESAKTWVHADDGEKKIYINKIKVDIGIEGESRTKCKASFIYELKMRIDIYIYPYINYRNEYSYTYTY